MGNKQDVLEGARSAGLLSQEHLGKDGVAIRVNMPSVCPYAVTSVMSPLKSLKYSLF